VCESIVASVLRFIKSSVTQTVRPNLKELGAVAGSPMLERKLAVAVA
jgi:hypothetical protein